MTETAQNTAAPMHEKPVLLQPDNHNKKYESLFVEIDTGQIRAYRHLSQARAQTKWRPARKFRAVFS